MPLIDIMIFTFFPRILARLTFIIFSVKCVHFICFLISILLQHFFAVNF